MFAPPWAHVYHLMPSCPSSVRAHELVVVLVLFGAVVLIPTNIVPSANSIIRHGARLLQNHRQFRGTGPPGVSRQLSPEQPRMLLLLPTMSHSLSNYTPYGHCFLHLQVDLPRTNLHCRGKEIRNAFSAPARPIGGYRMAHRHRMTSLSFPPLDAGMDAG